MSKSKSLQDLETRMQGMEPASLRYQTLDAARDFKTSWIRLGQHLFSVYKDKLYKDWGFLTFEAYSAKEVGIRQATAMKLLKSYSFLEKEEPRFIRQESIDEMKPERIPSFESVNVLRLAKNNEDVSEKEYRDLRETVMENPREDKEVKKKLRYILKSGATKKEVPDEEKKKAMAVKMIGYLENQKLELSRLFPDKVLKRLDDFLESLEGYK